MSDTPLWRQKSCVLNVKTILYIDIEEETLNVVIKYQSTEPIMYLKVKELKRKKTFKRNKNLLYIYTFAFCIYCSHALQTCYKGFAPSDEQHPLLLSLWTVHPSTIYSLICSGSMGLNPSMHWVKTLNKSPIHNANKYENKKDFTLIWTLISWTIFGGGKNMFFKVTSYNNILIEKIVCNN